MVLFYSPVVASLKIPERFLNLPHSYYMETKTCSTCKKDLDLISFSKNQAKKDGLNSICKECHRQYVKKHYEQNMALYKERAVVRSEKHRQDMSDKVNQFKSLMGCHICNETEPVALDFHHWNEPVDKKANISQIVKNGCSWETLWTEVHKCIVLCANCHRKVHGKRLFIIK